MKTRNAFTLVELLVVVAIIVILIAILTPSLERAMAMAQDMKCKTQLRAISTSFQMFGNDHARNLPGNYYTHYTEPDLWSWMGDEVWPDVPGKPGTILKYVGGPMAATRLYRCPSLGVTGPGNGNGSNGFFDYVSFLAFTGAKMALMPISAKVPDPSTGEWTSTPTPLITEEDPNNYINTSNREPGHAAGDRMATTHFKHANYASFDNSVSHYGPQKGVTGPATWDWKAVAPSGDTVDLSFANPGGGIEYGAWNRR